MSDKIFITANALLEDSFRLAQNIYDDGFRPNYLVGIWRGGTPVGIAVQELLDHLGVQSDHIAIRTSSYAGIEQRRDEIEVHGLHYIIENANADDSLLIIDDIFDTGRSAAAVIDAIRRQSRANTPATIKVATVYYKPAKRQVDFEPDYYLHETDQWVVFPHELRGLSEAEIAQHKPLAARPK